MSNEKIVDIKEDSNEEMDLWWQEQLYLANKPWYIKFFYKIGKFVDNKIIAKKILSSKLYEDVVNKDSLVDTVPHKVTFSFVGKSEESNLIYESDDHHGLIDIKKWFLTADKDGIYVLSIRDENVDHVVLLRKSEIATVILKLVHRDGCSVPQY